MNTFSNNSTDQIFIGIDVCKAELAIFNDSTGLHSTCPNQAKAITKLAKQLKKLKPTLIVLEATGGYETPAAIALSEIGLPFSIVYPRRVRQFALGLGIIAKTDQIDAQTLAYYGKVAGIEPKPLPTKELRQLQALTNRRLQLIEMRVAEESRLDTAPSSMRSEVKKHIRWLNKQIERFEQKIDRQIEASAVWQELDRQMQTVPGVGPVLSSTLITQLPELGAVSHKQLAALVGVAPFPSESGKHKGKRYCKGGRNSVRRVLYMATICATRYNPVIKEFYERLCERGKLKKVAIIACARKLLCILNAMVRNGCDWQQNIESFST